MLLSHAGLAAGVLVVSTAALWLRWALDVGAGPLAVAAGRLLVAAAIVVPCALALRAVEMRALDRRAWAVALLSGFFLALHFATWIASLRHTSVASSVALVTTNPIWVGLASWLLFRDPPGRRTVAGIAVAIGGSLMLVLADATGASPAVGGAPALGNLLAIAGAMAMSGYLLVGRRLNHRMSLLAYVAVVYGSAAFCMLTIAWLLGDPVTALPEAAWWPVLLVALGPQLVGHTLINLSLRKLSATFVALAVLGEPVGSAFLAWLFLGEGFGGWQALGFVTLLAGIAIAATEVSGSKASGGQAQPATGTG